MERIIKQKGIKERPTAAKVRSSRENLKKAVEALKLKRREKQLKVIDSQIKDLDISLNTKISEGIDKYFTGINKKQLKDEFLKVFYDVGGVQGLKKWIKEDSKNRGKYYEMLVAMLKVDEDAKKGQVGRVGVTIVYGNQNINKQVAGDNGDNEECVVDYIKTTAEILNG